jgi:hypothetical protein
MTEVQWSHDYTVVLESFLCAVIMLHDELAELAWKQSRHVTVATAHTEMHNGTLMTV